MNRVKDVHHTTEFSGVPHKNWRAEQDEGTHRGCSYLDFVHFLSGLLFANERCCFHSPALHPGAHYNLWDRAGSAEAER
jgi:hypothetical protein